MQEKFKQSEIPASSTVPISNPSANAKGFFVGKTGKITLIVGTAVLVLIIVFIAALGGGGIKSTARKGLKAIACYDAATLIKGTGVDGEALYKYMDDQAHRYFSSTGVSDYRGFKTYIEQTTLIFFNENGYSPRKVSVTNITVTKLNKQETKAWVQDKGNVGYQSELFPYRLSQISQVALVEADVAAQGYNEYNVVEYTYAIDLVKVGGKWHFAPCTLIVQWY